MAAPTHTLADLVAATGFTRRQIRFYIARGLVPGAGGRRGPNAAYPDATLRGLRRIRQLKGRRLPPTGRRLTLDEIGHALDAGDEEPSAYGIQSLPDAEDPDETPDLAALLTDLRAVLATLAAPGPGDAGRGDAWRRLVSRDLEIHVRAPADPLARVRLRALERELGALLERSGRS